MSFTMLHVTYKHMFVLSCADNTPTVEPDVAEAGLSDPDNLMLEISWNPLLQEDGGDFLQNYVVSIDVSPRQSKRRRRETEFYSENVPTNSSSFTYPNEVKPFTEYIVQVLAHLNVNGVFTIRPLTAAVPFLTVPAGKERE